MQLSRAEDEISCCYGYVRRLCNANANGWGDDGRDDGWNDGDGLDLVARRGLARRSARNSHLQPVEAVTHLNMAPTVLTADP